MYSTGFDYNVIIFLLLFVIFREKTNYKDSCNSGTEELPKHSKY
jgi:hypothetical protein